ncbi:MAG: hypothetical protein P1U34_11570 [Coxiellaceae bacterium]|nr:hypothetical protein [Coxiellaceae bacterium]
MSKTSRRNDTVITVDNGINAKHIGMFIAGVTGLYGITIFLGANLYQVKPSERDAKAYMNTISACIINFFVMFEIGRESLENACSTTASLTRITTAKCGGLKPSEADLNNLPSFSGVCKTVAYTTVSAFATVIYADLAPTLKDSWLSFVDTPAGYAGLMLANLFFHYYGTQNFVDTSLAGMHDALSDWVIALSPSKRAREHYLARSLDRDITKHFEQHLANSQLAREIQYNRTKKTLPKLNHNNSFYDNAALLAIDHKNILTHATAQSRLQKFLFTTLYASIIMALVPFFTDSFGIKPVKLMSFIGTFLANLGLTMMFTNKYSNALSQFALYRNVPPIFTDAKHHKGRVAAATGIVLLNTVLTYFTVNTTMKLFETIVKDHVKSQLENTMLVAGIWVGTIAFNVYAINKMVLGKVSAKILKDDPRYQFSTAADALRSSSAQELLKDKTQLHNTLGDHFPDNKRTLWTRHLQQGINDPANEEFAKTLRQQASSRINRNLYMGLLPVAAAITLTLVLQKTISDTPATELATDLGKYGVFIVAQIASQIYHACCASTIKKAARELDFFADAKTALNQPLVGELDRMEDGQSQRAANNALEADTGSPKHTTPAPVVVEQAKSACSLLRLVKGAAIGMAVEWGIRGVYAGLDTTIPENAVDTAATALGLTASFAVNR